MPIPTEQQPPLCVSAAWAWMHPGFVADGVSKGANPSSPSKCLQPSPPLASAPVTTLLNPTRAGVQLPWSRPECGLLGQLWEGMDAFLPLFMGKGLPLKADCRGCEADVPLQRKRHWFTALVGWRTQRWLHQNERECCK